MDDQGWTECRTSAERLKWARKRLHQTAKEAADSVGMKDGTYRQYERESGSSRAVELDHQLAAQFAKRFKVNYTWLLNGTLTPFTKDLSEHQERVVRVMSDKPDDEQKRIADAIERLLAG